MTGRRPDGKQETLLNAIDGEKERPEKRSTAIRGRIPTLTEAETEGGREVHTTRPNGRWWKAGDWPGWLGGRNNGERLALWRGGRPRFKPESQGAATLFFDSPLQGVYNRSPFVSHARRRISSRTRSVNDASPASLRGWTHHPSWVRASRAGCLETGLSVLDGGSVK